MQSTSLLRRPGADLPTGAPGWRPTATQLARVATVEESDGPISTTNNVATQHSSTGDIRPRRRSIIAAGYRSVQMAGSHQLRTSPDTNGLQRMRHLRAIRRHSDWLASAVCPCLRTTGMCAVPDIQQCPLTSGGFEGRTASTTAAPVASGMPTHQPMRKTIAEVDYVLGA